MTLVTLIGIAIAGGIGAVARFMVDGQVSARVGREFPFGTIAVNLSGTFALGVLVGAAVTGDAIRIFGTGLLGGYTTFSTWTFESQRLGEDGELNLAFVNLLVSLVLGLLTAWAGRRVGGAL